MGWLLYDTVGANYYPITNEKLVRQISGLNYVTCKLEDVVLASNTLVNVLDESGTIVFTGFIKKTADPTDDINRYEITERASELMDELCETSVGSNVYNFVVQTATIDTLLLFDVLAGTGWTSGSSDTTSMDEVAFYYETKFDALFRLLVDYRDHFVWFNNTTKYVYFGSSRTDRTASDVVYISKNAEVDSNNRVYDKIIVIGANDSITAWTGAHGGTVKCYQMPEIKSSYEASKMVGTLWSIMGTSNKGRVTCLVEPTSLYDEGDLVSIDGSNYIVYNVEMSAAGTKLVCDSRTSNINDVFVEEKYKPKYNSAASSGAGVTDHGALTGLVDDDHTQYLPINASRALTDDLYINTTTPHVILQEGGALRGSLYIESDDSTVLDAATEDLTLASASHNVNLFPAGTLQAKFTPTSFISYQDVVCDKTTLPGFVLYEGADYRGGIYTNSDDDTVIDCEHGDVILGTYASTGGMIKFQPKAGGNAFTIDSGGITSYQDLSMGANNIYLDSGILRMNNGTTLSGSIGFTTGVQNFIQRQLYSGSDYTLLSDQDYMHTWAILGTEKMHLSTADGLKMYTKINMNGLDINGLATPTLDYDAATKKYVDDNAGVGDFLADGSVPMTGSLNMGTNNITGIGATSHGAAAIFTTTDAGTFTFKALTTTILSFTKTLITFAKELAMGGNKVTGLGAGTSNGDAIRYEQLIGQYLPLGGGTLSGNLLLGTNNITGVGALGFGAAPVITTTDAGTITFKALTTTILTLAKTLITATVSLVARDHGTAATDEVVNVCYGTSATPPTASTTTEGALYIQYTA